MPHISAYQCTSMSTISATYQCQSVLPMSAVNQCHLCRLSVPISDVCECPPVMTVNAHRCHLPVPPHQ
ncbi:unnamed protein product, partial [Staurois parvus]